GGAGAVGGPAQRARGNPRWDRGRAVRFRAVVPRPRQHRAGVLRPSRLIGVSRQAEGAQPTSKEGVPAMAVKNDKQYEALKDKGMSKERAAKIANSPKASSRGGKNSHSGSSHGDTSKQGGTTA